ncbi:hypothetical protein WJX79_010531 [Trebouxia sp. C0005]
MTASQFLTSKPSTARLPAIQSRSSHRAARRLGGAVCSFHKSSRQEAASAPAVPAAFVSLVAAMPAHAAGAGAELVRPSTSAVQSAVDKAPTLLESTSIDQAVNSVVDVVKAGGGAVKNLAAAAGSGLQYAQQAYDRVAPVVQDAATTASPYVKSALTTAQDVAAPALRAVEPSVKASFGEAQRFLTAQGINPPVLADKAGKAGSAAEGVFNQAKPSLTSSLTSLTSRDPTTLAEYALGAVAFYYIAPPVLKLLFGSLRGYAGEINPAAALDAVAIGGNVVIVDIRTSREKENGGVPDLPFGNRLIEVEYAEIEDRKVRGQLQNVGAIERQVTALQIASLKKVNKRTQILLLDKNGSTSKAIAKELSRKGFRKIRVIQGGFSGWTSSKLQTKMSNTVSAVEILAPVFGTVKKAASSSNGNRTIRNALPTGR